MGPYYDVLMVRLPWASPDAVARLTDRQIFRLVRILTAAHEAQADAASDMAQALASPPEDAQGPRTARQEYESLIAVGAMFGTPRDQLDAEWRAKRGEIPE